MEINARFPSPQTISSHSSNMTIDLTEHDTTIPSVCQRSVPSSVSASQSLGSEETQQQGKAPFPNQVQSEQPSHKSSIVSDYRPYQLLMRTDIQMVWGKDLQQNCTIHLELLSCYSQKISDWFRDAKTIRRGYERCNQLKSELKCFVIPQLRRGAFIKEHRENEAIPIIIEIIEAYPLQEYRTSMLKVFDRCFNEALSKKMMKEPKSIGRGGNSRNYGDYDRTSRLKVLNSEAVLKVVEELYIKLREIKYNELKKAMSDPIRAAAQRRILLLKADDDVVALLVHWLNDGKISTEEAEYLYKLHNLASELGIVQLAETCLTKLLSAGYDAIHQAHEHGLSLENIIESFEELPSTISRAATVISTIFKHTITEKEAPGRLQEFVVDIICKESLKFYELLEPSISSNLARKLNKALLSRSEVKRIEFPCQGSQLAKTDSSFHAEEEAEGKEMYHEEREQQKVYGPPYHGPDPPQLPVFSGDYGAVSL